MTQSYEYKDVKYTMDSKWVKWENGCDYWECTLYANHTLDYYHGHITLEFHQGTLFKSKEPNIILVLYSLADNASAYDITYNADYETFLSECLLDDTQVSLNAWNKLEEQAEQFNTEILPENVTAVDMYNDLKAVS